MKGRLWDSHCLPLPKLIILWACVSVDTATETPLGRGTGVVTGTAKHQVLLPPHPTKVGDLGFNASEDCSCFTEHCMPVPLVLMQNEVTALCLSNLWRTKHLLRKELVLKTTQHTKASTSKAAWSFHGLLTVQFRAPNFNTTLSLKLHHQRRNSPLCGSDEMQNRPLLELQKPYFAGQYWKE